MIRSTFLRDVRKVSAHLDVEVDELGNPRRLTLRAADGYVWRATGGNRETRNVWHVFEVPDAIDAIDDEVLSRGVVKVRWFGR